MSKTERKNLLKMLDAEARTEAEQFYSEIMELANELRLSTKETKEACTILAQYA